MKYNVKLTSVGESVQAFASSHSSIIIFDKDTSYEFKDMVVTHTKGNLAADIVVGDKLVLADREYTISVVGDKANENLRQHGHVTFVFGANEVEMPGQVALKEEGAPRIMVGDTLMIG